MSSHQLLPANFCLIITFSAKGILPMLCSNKI